MVRTGYNSITVDKETMDMLKRIQEEGNYKTIPETIRSLVLDSKSEINYKIRLLMHLVDSDRDPFSYLMLEAGASEGQVNAIFDLMDKIEKNIRNKKKVFHHDFEKEIYAIFPDKHGDYHFAENIVSTLGEKGRWILVYRYMKKNGMNL